MFALPNDPLLQILLLVFIFLGGLVVSLVFINIFNLVGKWFSSIDPEKINEIESVKNEALQKANQILEDAKISSLKIIEESTRKAQKIVQDTSEINIESKKKLDNVLNSMLEQSSRSVVDLSNNFMSLYEKTLQVEQTKSLELIKNVAQNAEKSLIKNVTNFENQLYQHTIKNEDDVKDLIHQEYMKAHNEIERYKITAVRELDSKILSLIKEVSKEIFTESIEIPLHQELVLQILNKNKDKFLL